MEIEIPPCHRRYRRADRRYYSLSSSLKLKLNAARLYYFEKRCGSGGDGRASRARPRRVFCVDSPATLITVCVRRAWENIEPKLSSGRKSYEFSIKRVPPVVRQFIMYRSNGAGAVCSAVTGRYKLFNLRMNGEILPAGRTEGRRRPRRKKEEQPPSSLASPVKGTPPRTRRTNISCPFLLLLLLLPFLLLAACFCSRTLPQPVQTSKKLRRKRTRSRRIKKY